MKPWPCYSENEIGAAAAVLRAGKVNYWTGEECRKFEQEFAEFCNARHAVAVANGTVALELALRALDIGPGDEVVVPARTFIASASCVVACGAKPIFADVDRDSQNLTAESVLNVLSPRTKAIIAVHLAGWACDMDPLLALAAQRNLKVVEDCAQAHGATYKGRRVGALGDVAGFSFCQDKIISTAGEGGMLVTNDSDVWEKAWSYKDHGKSYHAVYHQQHPPGFHWVHHSLGTNWRMTEISAAIGRLQLEKLEAWLERRRENAAILTHNFQVESALRVTRPPDHIGHAYYKYLVFVRPDRLKPGWSRDRIMMEISSRGVPCFTGPCAEVYMERAFESGGYRPAQRLPVAKELGETGLAFLVHPTLSDEDMRITCDVVDSVLSEAIRAISLPTVATEDRELTDQMKAP